MRANEGKKKKKKKKRQKVINLVRSAVESELFSPGTHGLCEGFEDSFRVLPIDASICDTDAVLETSLSLGRNLLVT
jgi:hypothetical protein